MPELRINVLPYPGAVGTVKGFATGEIDGYYGSDVALKELANNSGRFKDFKSQDYGATCSVILVLYTRRGARHQG